ncbi:hypothetical protein HPB47_026219 [Ixodes persulcatus]|uniref:Uncharacterized protein n=1 Tax=Ixodes persulcatus TaxID=34615 RepID=A0AC60Q1B9_IXOPE|nr:hypothetical protein HPB47_026219 [Ixodes persulcatus]
MAGSPPPRFPADVLRFRVAGSGGGGDCYAAADGLLVGRSVGRLRVAFAGPPIPSGETWICRSGWEEGAPPRFRSEKTKGGSRVVYTALSVFRNFMMASEFIKEKLPSRTLSVA